MPENDEAKLNLFIDESLVKFRIKNDLNFNDLINRGEFVTSKDIVYHLKILKEELKNSSKNFDEFTKPYFKWRIIQDKIENAQKILEINKKTSNIFD